MKVQNKTADEKKKNERKKRFRRGALKSEFKRSERDGASAGGG